MEKEDKAREIAQDLLDSTRLAMIRGDTDAFVAHFLLPHKIETFAGSITHKTKQDLKDQLAQVLAFNVQLKVTSIKRYCLEASFKEAGEIECVYVTHLFAGEVEVRAPHSTFVLLRPVDGIWKIAYTMYNVEASDTNYDVLMRRSANQAVLTLD